jgi:hypothetical protein
MNMIDCCPLHFFTIGEDITLTIKCEDNQNLVDTTHYRFVIGKLMYAAVSTRPDITFAVSFLACYAHDPTEHHLKMIKTLLRYLSMTSHYSICYPATQETIKLATYSNAD